MENDEGRCKCGGEYSKLGGQRRGGGGGLCRQQLEEGDGQHKRKVLFQQHVAGSQLLE